MKQLLLILGVALCLDGAMLVTTGCKMTPQAATYATVGTTATTVEATLGEWNAWVKATHPPVTQEIAVRDAYRKYQASMVAVCDAGSIYSAYSSTNTAGAAGVSGALQTAIANAQQSIGDLQNLVTAFKGK